MTTPHPAPIHRRRSLTTIRQNGTNGKILTVHSTKATKDFAVFRWLSRATLEEELQEVEWIEQDGRGE
jgi:hypothetical protein